jgi:hypothetical protein
MDVVGDERPISATAVHESPAFVIDVKIVEVERERTAGRLSLYFHPGSKVVERGIMNGKIASKGRWYNHGYAIINTVGRVSW